MSASTESRTDGIERVSKDAFKEEFERAERPVVITGALSDWAAADKWSPQYLTSVLKEKPVVVKLCDDDRFNIRLDGSTEFEQRRLGFSAAQSMICSPTPSDKFCYLSQASIPDAFPELMGDIRTPPWVDPGRILAVNLWFGSARVVSQLHFDLSNNFFAQVYGRKRFVFFPPAQTELLYPFPADSPDHHRSRVEVDSPDLEKYPLFRRAKPLQAVVNPGELLFLPAFWWHHVRSLDVSISVNFWWPADLKQVFAPNLLRLIPAYYREDGLAMAANMLAGMGLSLLDAASLFFDRRLYWAAVLFAGASLDQRLPEMRRNLFRTPDPSDSEKINSWTRLMRSALDVHDDDLSAAEVFSMLQGVKEFLSDGH